MKRYLLTGLACLFFITNSIAQTTISFATGGSPVYAAPWVLGGSASGISTSHIQLTPPSGSQTGRIYTSTPITLTGCGSFTAEFEFQVIPSSSAWAIADGIAFWILSPLSGFGGGGGIGLPTNPNGLVLVLDNYDNDGVANDPLISLYGYPTGFTGTYTEGVTTNRIGALNNQVFVSDGGWHHVKVTYAGGQVKVYFNHSAIPGISGTFPITSTNLYFGFCAATGGAWSTQSVRNCIITFDNVSPISGPNVVCMGTTGIYTDSTSGGTWSSSNTAVGTISTSGVLTPISAGTTTVSYTYGSGPCYATKIVTVNATTLPAIGGPNPLCSSTVGTYTNSATGGTWSTSTPLTGTIDPTTGALTPLSAGTAVITYTLPVGCYRSATVTINTAPPPINITPSPASVCDNGSLTLTAAAATTYNLIPPQSFENGVPTTAGVPVDGWTYVGTAPANWYGELGVTAVNPAIAAAYAGSYVANFHCRSLGSGQSGTLYSPTFSLVGVSSAVFSIWVYRDATAAYNNVGYNTEALNIFLFNSASSTVTSIGQIPRRTGLGITGPITGTSTPGTSGWYQYTYTLTSTTGTANYIYIAANCANGNNIYIDDITVVGTIGSPTWSPTTYLYNDGAFTIPYVSTALNPVYMHPTGITTPTNITYTASLSNGICSSTGTRIVTMNPNPAPIAGTTLICVGSTVPLSSTTTGGSWSSSNTGVASIGSSSGSMTGIGAGTATITYAFGGCYVTTTVTVVTSPGAITGIPTVCLGNTTLLSNSVAGGVWSSSVPAVGTVDPATGVVTGLSVGTTVISYGIATCYSTLTVSVNPYPSPITGSLGVCVGATTALSSSPAGGFWFTSSPPIATVGVTSGIVTGNAVGTAVISYRLGGCSALATVNVVSTPGSMTGSLSTCVGSTTTLSHAVSGGTWTSSDISTATVGSSTGVVTGVATGTARITYAVGTGCFTTSVVTVTAAPVPPAGTLNICEGGTTTLSHGIPGGTWSLSCGGLLSVGFGTGIVTSTMGSGSGTCVVTYTLPSGCLAMATVTVAPITAPITGTLSLCAGGTTTLSTATPVTSWSSSSPAVATISSGGVVTGISAGTATMTCPAIGGCPTTAVVTVNPTPSPITGTLTVCQGATTALSSFPSGGVWTCCAGSTISGTGLFTGLVTGTCAVTYTTPGGCFTTTTVTVNPNPAALSGTLGICVGGNTTLTPATSCGCVWSSSAPLIANILGPGFIGGVAVGTATISYINLSTGCASTAMVTVNTAPGPIAGTLAVCQNNTTTLTNSAPGGSWSVVTPAIGTIDATTGAFTGLTPGTTVVSYSLGFGCAVGATVTVNAPPVAIGGTLSLCAGTSTTLTGSAGTIWTCACPGIASITTGGALSAIGAGTCMVTNTFITTGCVRTATVTVNALPGIITGGTNICIGATTTLTSTPAGGTWTSSNGNAAVIGSTGVVTGAFAGTSTLSYTLPSGCYRTAVVLVSPLPTSISPSGAGAQVCEGSTLTFTGLPSGGTWSSACPAIGTISAGSGIFNAFTAGTCTVTYTSVAGCSISSALTVNSLPAPISGVLSACVGQCTTLTATPGPGTWAASTGSGSATIVPATGVLCGSASGTVNVSYTLPTGCRRTAVATVNALPGLITGAGNVCAGATSTLNCTPSGGTWSMTCAYATIGVTTGVLGGLSAGTCDVTYTAGAGCYSTRTITVNPVPNPITGSATTCMGQCTALASTTSGGAWSSSTTSVGTINTSTTSLCGVSAGTTIVSYTLPTSCRATLNVTVYGLPAAITGSLQVCAGSTGSLTTSTPGGTWACSCPGIATVDAFTGAISGIAAGTCEVTYTVGTGCSVTQVISVNAVPAPITGTLQVCAGQTTTLSNITTPGTWSSTAVGTASVVPTTGVVTGIIPGTATISYTVASGCSSTAVVSVSALPSAITGPAPMWVCENSTISLISSPLGGTWSTPHTTVSVDASSGAVTGLTAGTAVISYSQGIGCVQTTTITVNAQPAAITGNLNVCLGFTQMLSTTTTTGTWSSDNTTAAPVDPSGLVHGLALGMANISYTLPITGCSRSVQVTVQPLPSTITGPSGFCNLSTAHYSSSPSGGTWSTASSAILTVDPSSGDATGVSVDTTDLIYTLPTGCQTSKRVFLILAPYPISGPHDMCLGQTRTLGNIITGGTWSSSAPLTCSVNPATGDVVGNSIGVATITYILSSGCYSTYDVTVNTIPTGVSGPIQICESSLATYTCSTPSGTWSSSNASLADIGSLSGIATAVGSSGVVTITYTLGTGCNAMLDVTVNPLPTVITAPSQVCEGGTATGISGPPGGVWSSHDPSVLDIDASTGFITGMSATTTGIGGTGATMITYTLPTSCLRTHNMTVNPLPSLISGVMNVCVGDITTLSNPTPGGGWISSLPAIGTIDGVTGIFGGVSAGATTVSYLLGTGCVATWPMTVHANPAPIGGSLSVCAGFATNLSSGPAGGVWSQAPMSMTYGTIHSLTGVVSAVTAGIIPVTYTLGSGCRAVNEVTVVTLPSVIGGTPRVCVGETTVMTNTVAGGVWTSSNIARATIDPASGIVLGIAPGTAVITYTVGTGCFNVHTITVNANPAPITGPLQVCEGSTIALATATTGGLWTTSSTVVANVGFLSGIVSGVSAGTANISYTISATGCHREVQVTVESTPAPISGNVHICMGTSNTFTSTSAGGVWYSSNPAIATINPSSGVATAVSVGSVTISYVYPSTGCMATKVVSVQPLPVVYNVTGGGNYCSGGIGVHVNLSGSQPGVSYELYYGSSATGFTPGTGFPIDFGLHTLGGTYTVQATNVTSGCKRNMTGSATIIVNPLVTPSVTINTAPYDSVCPGQSVTLTPAPVNGGTAPAYLWKVNGTTVSTASVYAFAPANGDNVTVTMTSNASCLATAVVTGAKTLTVLPNEMPVAGMLATPGDTICQYSPVTLTAAPMFGGPSPSYTWLVNGTVAGSGPAYSYVPVDGDVVNLKMTSDYRCRLANTVTSEDLALSVDPLLIPHVTIAPEPGLAVEAGKPITLHAVVTDGGTNPKYQWKVNGKAIAGATTGSYTAIFNDYDSIACEIISGGVCGNIGTSDWVFITMWQLATHQPIKGATDIRLVPNPNKGVFTIKGTFSAGIDEEVNADVTDMLGQVVYRGVLKAKQGRIDTQVQLENNLANGMYILTLRTGTEQKVFHFVMEQ